MDKQAALDDYNKLNTTLYLKEIEDIVVNTRYYLEGNCFFRHNTFDLYPELKHKQANLYWCAKQLKPHAKLCEIGFNAGHSALLFLLSSKNIPLHFTIFDLGCHPYTRPCLNYLASKFPNTVFEYIEGNSILSFPEWIKIINPTSDYDLVHVDGGHTLDCIKNDMKNASRLLKHDGLLIVDDTNVDYISEEVNSYLETKNYVEIDILETTLYKHRVIKKV
jgi:predicted O-methyltransferase YrrM